MVFESYGLIIVAVLVIGFIVYYINRFAVLANIIDNSWSQIDVQLKKRNDLVPNLVETVKGYAKHEQQAIKAVTEARVRMMQAGTVEEKAAAGNMMSDALKTIFAISENYPQLKANENFMMLQEELSGIENKIAYARQHYNDSVLVYNNLATTIPGSLFAGALGRKVKPYLETDAKEREPVKVKF
ncbi:MAG: LemA family protein [archaeon]